MATTLVGGLRLRSMSYELATYTVHSCEAAGPNLLTRPCERSTPSDLDIFRCPAHLPLPGKEIQGPNQAANDRAGPTQLAAAA